MHISTHAALLVLTALLAFSANAQTGMDGAGAIHLDTNRRQMPATMLWQHGWCGDGAAAGKIYGGVVAAGKCEWDGELTSCTNTGNYDYICMPTMSVIAEHVVRTGIPFRPNGCYFGFCAGGTNDGTFCEEDATCTGGGTCTTTRLESSISTQYSGMASLPNRLAALAAYQTAYTAAGGVGDGPFEGGLRADTVAAINNLSSCTGACADDIEGTATFDTPWAASMLRTIPTSDHMDTFDPSTGKTRGGFGSWSNRSTIWYQAQEDAISAAESVADSCCHKHPHVLTTTRDNGASCNGTEAYECVLRYGSVVDDDDDYVSTRDDQALGVSAYIPDIENADYRDFIAEYLLRNILDMEEEGVGVDNFVLSGLSGKPYWNSALTQARFDASSPRYACSTLADNQTLTWRGTRSSTDPTELTAAGALYCNNDAGATGTHAGGTFCTSNGTAEGEGCHFGTCVADVCTSNGDVSCVENADCVGICTNDCSGIGPIIEPNWLGAGAPSGRSNSWQVGMKELFLTICEALDKGLDGINNGVGEDDRDGITLYTEGGQVYESYETEWVDLEVRRWRHGAGDGTGTGKLCWAGAYPATSSTSPITLTVIPVPAGHTARTP